MMVRAMVASEKSGSEPETRKKRKSGSDPMVREVVAHGVSLREWVAEDWERNRAMLEWTTCPAGGATVEQFLGWFPGVARAQRLPRHGRRLMRARPGCRVTKLPISASPFSRTRFRTACPKASR